mmetsp:Transcript_8260/g.25515  ORF Transcript_8260/g.25515 Transcript_8260/m.25515 type:complete len:429 (-) Transcript_8260:721-2007(-)
MRWARSSPTARWADASPRSSAPRRRPRAHLARASRRARTRTRSWPSRGTSTSATCWRRAVPTRPSSFGTWSKASASRRSSTTATRCRACAGTLRRVRCLPRAVSRGRRACWTCARTTPPRPRCAGASARTAKRSRGTLWIPHASLRRAMTAAFRCLTRARAAGRNRCTSCRAPRSRSAALPSTPRPRACSRRAPPTSSCGCGTLLTCRRMEERSSNRSRSRTCAVAAFSRWAGAATRLTCWRPAAPRVRRRCGTCGARRKTLSGGYHGNELVKCAYRPLLLLAAPKEASEHLVKDAAARLERPRRRRRRLIRQLARGDGLRLGGRPLRAVGVLRRVAARTEPAVCEQLVDTRAAARVHAERAGDEVGALGGAHPCGQRRVLAATDFAQRGGDVYLAAPRLLLEWVIAQQAHVGQHAQRPHIHREAVIL